VNICPDYYIFDQNNECIECESPCLSCSQIVSNCISCIPNYILIGEQVNNF
jgi:hypothetical protein